VQAANRSRRFIARIGSNGACGQLSLIEFLLSRPRAFNSIYASSIICLWSASGSVG
jgi:hypothetical protein